MNWLSIIIIYICLLMLIIYIYNVKKKEKLNTEIDAILKYQVTKQDLYMFNKIVYEEIKFEKFVLESSEATYRIDKTNKVITVLQRNYRLFLDEINFCSANDAIDFEVMRLCKIAKKAGFNYIFENKYLN